jgi:hypothetical protein
MIDCSSIHIICSCGAEQCAKNDRREHYRKPLRVAGTVHTKKHKAMSVQMNNVSKMGAQFKVHHDPQENIFKENGLIVISFCLDDRRRSEITDVYRVKNINGKTVGAELVAEVRFSDATKNKGFWLRNHK